MRQNGQLMAFAGTWTPYNSMTDEEELANAKLIAAAPDLLDALLDFLTGSSDYIKAKAAIEKAIGNGKA